MRNVKWIVSHCTAGPQNQTTKEILNYWKKKNGWTKPGYHFLISADGSYDQLLPITQISNGVAGYNKESIHICCKGGQNNTDDRTDAQIKTQLQLILKYKNMFPNAVILGHRDFSTDQNGNGIIEKWEWIKFCPGYDVRDWISMSNLDKATTPVHIIYKLNYPLIKNDTVKAIQRALKIKDDGVFGKDTDKAVREFQIKHNLNPDGVVGKDTAQLLGVSI